MNAQAIRNLVKSLLLALILGTAGLGMISPQNAEAQGTRRTASDQSIVDGDIPSLVVPVQAKSTLSPRIVAKGGGEQGPVLRQRAVGIDFSVLQTVFDSMAADGQPKVIRIPFFDNASLIAEITEIMATSSGGLAYVGRVPDAEYSSVVLVNNNGVVSINVSAKSKRYAIHGAIESGFVASEPERLDLPDHTSPPIKVNAPPLSAVSRQFAADTLPRADTGPEIDVMVVYTPVVRANNGGTAQMNANIDAQVALTNLIYTNSNVTQRIRIVYKGEVAYTETTDGVDLGRLQNPNDGFMDTVPLLRDIYRADFVSLWGNYPSTCGLGYEMGTESSGFADNAYNTVNSPGCTGAGSGTFAHELGHNMGLKHDNFADMTPITNVTPEGSTTPIDIFYAHGYVDLVNRFRTVMAYDDQCVASGFNCERSLIFSNPNIPFDNSAYFPGANPLAPAGNETNANERRALNDTLETTRNFRAALPASAFTGPGVIVFSPARYSVAEGGGSVQLTIERHVGFTGAISVNFATVSGTATEGTDFTTTSGTLNWASGDATARTIMVPIVQDTLLEGRETFTVTLSAPGGGASIGALNGTTTSATVTINDDEPDTFPTGGVVPSGYVTPGNSAGAWTVDQTDGFMSNTSLQSAAVFSPGNDVYANSDLAYSSVFAAGNVSFSYRVSSLGTDFANLEFSIDNIVVFSSAGGDTGWLSTSQPITAGAHTLRWRFRNRVESPCAGFVAPVPPPNCRDRAWIDTVVLPLALVNGTTTLASSRNPSSLGQTVTFTATVAGGAGVPAGNVAFLADGAVIAGCAAVALSGGSAQCATSSLVLGARNISAQYAGNTVYNPSTSSTFIQTVQRASAMAPLLFLLLD